MKRRVCENCMREYEIERNDGTPFPSFTVLGGILGAFAGLVGSLILVPAGLIAGLAIDVFRCDQCGSDEGELYELMIEKDDLWDDKIYQSILHPFNESPKSYQYDELEGRFLPVEPVDASTDIPEINMFVPDFSADYDISFGTPDPSLEVGLFGTDLGAGEGCGTSGSGEGGSPEGSASGGETGGGES
ncbi:MAG: hypothetical protein GTN74_05050 [Proteobacteria bacterium]|nr:hypothetical protein [Pseudomonadota bacterium]